MNQTMNMPAIEIQQENARFMSGVYKWMTIGILLTSLISYYVSRSPELINVIVMNKFVFYGLIIAQLGAVFYLSIRIEKMSAVMATIIYLAYAALTGLTLSVIFLIYTQDSIEQVFMITSFAFAGLSAFGYFTKRDLGPIGTFCTMGLFGLVGFSIISLFFPSLMTGQVSYIYSIAGVIIFSGLTAYDTQKIKASNIIGNEGTAEDHKETIFGALTLYLDFINLFLMLLRLMGGRRK
jgi:FtsH-binding integral membrane protein